MDTAEENSFTEHTENYSLKYLQFASSLIAKYNGVEPFYLYLKKYFSANKKHGSRDRKQITSLCYNYFRLGNGVSPQVSLEDKFLLGIFLCELSPSALLATLKSEWNEQITELLKSKLKIVEESFDVKNIFSFNRNLSERISTAQFALSFLVQPKLFIRIRPRKTNSVIDKIKKANFSFEKMNNDCLAFAHNEKVTDIISVDKEAVVQDYNSQRVGETILKYFTVKDESPVSVWDCCAGSGGKSILVTDILKNIELTVTDKRSSILQNLQKRFASADIRNYKSFVAGLSGSITPSLDGFVQKQNLIIADVPCSGSGTWSRTPELLIFFKEKEIERYAQLQKSIIKIG